MPRTKKAFVPKTCDLCKKKMEVQPSFILRGRGKYCSKKCMYEGQSQKLTGKQPKYLWGKRCNDSN
jgi:hypothetical protein